MLLTGCKLPGPGSQQPPAPDLTEPTSQALTPTSKPETAASIHISEATETPVLIPGLPADATADPDLLRFTFPTAAPEPISSWRPPLYPIPWEPTAQDHFYFLRPIGANEINWPLAKYRYGGVFFENVVHSGVDIPAPLGAPVLAAASGKVVWSGYGLFYNYEEFDDPYGLAIAIKHDFGYQGQLAVKHLQTIAVDRVQPVLGGVIAQPALGAHQFDGLGDGPAWLQVEAMNEGTIHPVAGGKGPAAQLVQGQFAVADLRSGINLLGQGSLHVEHAEKPAGIGAGDAVADGCV